jgi:methylated-DNA-[protein]-cysteine S-methyltransferase
MSKIKKTELIGTPFQVKVWDFLQTIPSGETRTYQQVAIAIGHPKSARAVANACGKNPLPIIIPCHRVIRSDGLIGGYSAKGGTNKKKSLLLSEKYESQ